MIDKIADYLIDKGGIFGVLLVASWTIFVPTLGILWRVWRKAETDFDKERVVLYKMIQQEQQAKFEAALHTLMTTNTTMSELKTLVLQMLTKP